MFWIADIDTPPFVIAAAFVYEPIFILLAHVVCTPLVQLFSLGVILLDSVVAEVGQILLYYPSKVWILLTRKFGRR